MYPALCKGEGREERTSEHAVTYHIYQRCLSRPPTHLMLQCHPQMSGIDSGPSAVTMRKWSRKQRQDWQKKEKRRRQRETTAHAAVGADMAVAAQNPGAPHSDTALGRCQLTLPTHTLHSYSALMLCTLILH